MGDGLKLFVKLEWVGSLGVGVWTCLATGASFVGLGVLVVGLVRDGQAAVSGVGDVSSIIGGFEGFGGSPAHSCISGLADIPAFPSLCWVS